MTLHPQCHFFGMRLWSANVRVLRDAKITRVFYGDARLLNKAYWLHSYKNVLRSHLSLWWQNAAPSFCLLWFHIPHDTMLMSKHVFLSAHLYLNVAVSVLKTPAQHPLFQKARLSKRSSFQGSDWCTWVIHCFSIRLCFFSTRLFK